MGFPAGQDFMFGKKKDALAWRMRLFFISRGAGLTVSL